MMEQDARGFKQLEHYGCKHLADSLYPLTASMMQRVPLGDACILHGTHHRLDKIIFFSLPILVCGKSGLRVF